MKTVAWVFALVILMLPLSVRAEAPRQIPEHVVAQYLLEMEKGSISPNLPVYSEASKRMMILSPSNNSQASRNLFRAYLPCIIDRTQVLNGFAVVRYRLQDRRCAPFFLIEEKGEWKLDMVMMRQALRFDQISEWRFDLGVRNPYSFAFQDWKFDRVGKPIAVLAPKK